MAKENAWGLVFAGIAALSGLVYILRSGKDGATNVYNFPPLQSSVNGAENVPSNINYQEPLPNPVPANQSSPVIVISGAGQPIAGGALSDATEKQGTRIPVPWPVYTV